VKLRLISKAKTETSTISELFIDGAFECYVLEDTIREFKIKHETAIPAGMYQVTLTYSNRFKKLMPLLLKVPNFEGIRIHSGNYAKDTSGCLLVGQTYGKDFVGKSKAAYDELFDKLKKAFDLKEQIEIEIIR